MEKTGILNQNRDFLQLYQRGARPDASITGWGLQWEKKWVVP